MKNRIEKKQIRKNILIAKIKAETKLIKTEPKLTKTKSKLQIKQSFQEDASIKNEE